MFTTMPRFMPRDGVWPMPTTFSWPSSSTSATIATIFEVPMSSPTSMFLLSFGLLTCCSSKLLVCFSRRCLVVRHAHGKSVGVTQVHGLNAVGQPYQRVPPVTGKPHYPRHHVAPA